MLSTSISIGDIAIMVGLVGTAAANYFGVVNKIKAVDYKLEELRRGRGLILEHWPHAVRRCFGFNHVRDE